MGHVRSLLSAEGVRWFCGSFSEMLATPLLVNILLCAMAWGCLWRSRLFESFVRQTDERPCDVHRRVARRLAWAVLAVCLVCVALLAVVPHAVLLSATGHLWPSPFSRAVVPMTALVATLVSAVYGLAARSFRSFADVVDSFAYGICMAAPLLVLYVFAAQFWRSMVFVFG